MLLLINHGDDSDDDDDDNDQASGNNNPGGPGDNDNNDNDDEANFKKTINNDYARISSASSGDSPRAEWLDSGEPTGPSIHNTDLTVLYENVSKLEEKPWSSLPRKTRQWFIDNLDLQCPAEFQFNNAPYNKEKKSTRNVSFAEAGDDFSGNKYETNTEPSLLRMMNLLRRVMAVAIFEITNCHGVPVLLY